MRLNLGSGTHYVEGWLNLDVRADDHTKADVIVSGTDPFASFGSGSAEAVYLGHVLEHVPWPDVPRLLAEVHRVLAPGGEMLAVGPDVRRLAVEWHEGRESWELLIDAMEHQDLLNDYWPEAVHKWNCHEARLHAVIAAVFNGAHATRGPFDGWPVVSWSAWQCAVTATK